MVHLISPRHGFFRTVEVYPKWNARIQVVHATHPRPLPYNPPTDTSLLPPDSRELKVSLPLLNFAKSLQEELGYSGPVSQLNLLSFNNPTSESRESYGNYGKATATAGGRHGGRAKISGEVVQNNDSRKEVQGKWWDSIGIAQFPSLWHWIDMAGDPEYQRVNSEFRLPVSLFRVGSGVIKVGGLMTFLVSLWRCVGMDFVRRCLIPRLSVRRTMILLRWGWRRNGLRIIRTRCEGGSEAVAGSGVEMEPWRSNRVERARNSKRAWNYLFVLKR